MAEENDNRQPPWMRRSFSVILMVVGAVVTVLAGDRAANVHPVSVQHPVDAPVTFARALTVGPWSVYGQARTGPYGSALVLVTTVTAPDGSAVALTDPSDVTTLRTDGKIFAVAATMRIVTAGTYEIHIVTEVGTPLPVLVNPSPHARFPWDALTIDGVVVLAVGASLTGWDVRRRRRGPVEVAYTPS